MESIPISVGTPAKADWSNALHGKPGQRAQQWRGEGNCTPGVYMYI